MRGKLAIGITANFVNGRTVEETQVPEISGVARIYNQKFFQSLLKATGQARPRRPPLLFPLLWDVSHLPLRLGLAPRNPIFVCPWWSHQQKRKNSPPGTKQPLSWHKRPWDSLLNAWLLCSVLLHAGE